MGKLVFSTNLVNVTDRIILSKPNDRACLKDFSLFRLVRLSPIITVGLRRKHHTTMNCIIIAVRLMSPFYLFDTLQQRSLEASSRHPNIELGGIRQDHGKLSLLDFLWSGVPLDYSIAMFGSLPGIGIAYTCSNATRCNVGSAYHR